MSVEEKLRQAETKDLFSELNAAQREYDRIIAEIISAIIQRRKELGISQANLAKKMSVSQSMISQWESGDCNLTIKTIVDIMDSLDIQFNVCFEKREYTFDHGFYVNKNTETKNEKLYYMEEIGVAA